MPDASCIEATARELKKRYGDLLKPPRGTPAREAVRAIEAACERLHGGREVPDAQQMTLDLRGAPR